MVGIGFVTKATHLAVYDAPVGTYDKLSFRVHNFGERWLGVATRAKAALPHNSCLRPVWQRRLQIRGVTVPPLLPLSPLVSVLLLIGLAGCSKDRGELALKKKPPFIDLDACEDNAPQAVTVRELAETTARLPINSSHRENGCRKNLPIGEQDNGEILLVGAPRPALAFVTPSLPPMPIIPPTDGVSPENNMSKDDMSKDDMFEQGAVQQIASLPPPSEIPVMPNPEIAEREPSPEQEPVPPPKEDLEVIISPPRVIQPEPENSAPSPADAMLPPIEEPEDEMPDQEEVGQKPSLPPPSEIPVIPNPQIADRDPSPEREPVSPPKAEPKVIISPPRVIQPAPENSAPENSAPENSVPSPAENSLPLGLLPSTGVMPPIKELPADDGRSLEELIGGRVRPTDEDRADEDGADEDGAGNDGAGEDGAGEDGTDANPPLIVPTQPQVPIVGVGDHSGATTPLVILGSNHFDQPIVGSAHGNIINFSTGGSVKNPQLATLGQGADNIIYGIGVGNLSNSWQPYDGAQKFLNFDIGTDKLWFKVNGEIEGWVHDMDALLLRIHRGSISYVTADSGTDGNPNHDIITSVVVAGPVHRSINLVFYQIELHFHQPDDQRAAFNIYSQKPNDFEWAALATFIEIMGDSFGMINDWNDLGYDEGTLPTENMPAIL